MKILNISIQVPDDSDIKQEAKNILKALNENMIFANKIEVYDTIFSDKNGFSIGGNNE